MPVINVYLPDKVYQKILDLKEKYNLSLSDRRIIALIVKKFFLLKECEKALEDIENIEVNENDKQKQ